jgi:hypothetical protein
VSTAVAISHARHTDDAQSYTTDTRRELPGRARILHNDDTAMRHSKLWIPLSCILPFACADDDVGDSPEGWRAANAAIAMGQSQFSSQVQVNVEGEIEVSCTDGGSLTMAGNYADAEEFTFVVTYDACSVLDVTIDGELTFEGGVQTTENSVEVSARYSGTLTWSGAANGSCEIDAETYVGVSTDRDSADADIRFEGSICGHSASAVIEASADLE